MWVVGGCGPYCALCDMRCASDGCSRCWIMQRESGKCGLWVTGYYVAGVRAQHIICAREGWHAVGWVSDLVGSCADGGWTVMRVVGGRHTAWPPTLPGSFSPSAVPPLRDHRGATRQPLALL